MYTTEDPTVRNWFKKKRVRTCSTYLRVLYAQNSLCIHFDSMGLCVNCIVQYSFRTSCQNKSSKESKSRTCPNRMSVGLGRGLKALADMSAKTVSELNKVLIKKHIQAKKLS